MERRFEDGRRYQADSDGVYMLPNDEAEFGRLDIQHHITRLTLDGNLYLAPISQSPSVLDLGTGTGLWATEFAAEDPSSHVLGVDLAATQPSARAPSNCSFVVGDVEGDWEFARDEKFDYIHARFLTLALKDWPTLFRRCVEHLKPGGWLELQEILLVMHCDDDSNPKKAFATFFEDIHAAALKIGIDAWQANRFGPMLSVAGFQNEQTIPGMWPVGGWHEHKKEKAVGVLNQKNMVKGVSAAAVGFLTRVLGRPKEEVDKQVQEVVGEIDDPSVHQYLNLFITYAQKPETALELQDEK